MTLPAPVDLDMARAAAEALMRSACVITRATGEKTWNETSGTYTPAAPEVIYTGRCKVQENVRTVQEVTVGERERAISPLELHLPIEGSGAVRRGDDVAITENPDDPALVGCDFIVQAFTSATTKTARRLPIQAVS